MSLLFALFLVVHGSIPIGYICGPAWPFAAADPWAVTLLGASPDGVRAVGIGLVLLSFFGYLLAAVAATGVARALLPLLIVVASVASAAVLIMFATVWTLPGLAIDAVLLWAALVRGWRPTPLFGRERHGSTPSRELAR